MSHQELLQADFQSKAGLIEAERVYIRSQIGLLEAQLKQNSYKQQELEFQWKEFVESVNKAQQPPEESAPVETKPAKKLSKS